MDGSCGSQPAFVKMPFANVRIGDGNTTSVLSIRQSEHKSVWRRTGESEAESQTGLNQDGIFHTRDYHVSVEDERWSKSSDSGGNVQLLH